MKKVRKASIPRLGKDTIEKLSIPIPPLSVQTEIVQILDTLTALTSELTSELILRRKQYEYYREKLLSFDSLERLNEGGGRRNLLMWLKSKMEKIGNILEKVIFQSMALAELWDMLIHIPMINLQY